MTDDATELANLLRDLYLGLEDKGLQQSSDYGLARGYEDQLGSGQNMVPDLVQRAQALLRRHGFK